MRELTVETVVAQAPDDASVKAARGLVAPAKWQTLAGNDVTLWGECKGSGSRPYQVRVDLHDMACKCSCPSRKFPCKHALALMLLRVQNSDAFTSGEPPEWVAEWLASRQQRAERKEEKEQKAKTVDPEVAARRDAARWDRMAAGVDELERWLSDRIRYGIAQLSGKSQSCRDIAARMVDAQLPGMAARLKEMEMLIDAGSDWPARLLGQMGEIQLLLDAFRQREALTPEEQADLRTALGVTMDKSDVADQPAIEDDWLILGQHVEEDGKLWRRRVWLYGKSCQRTALLLEFSHGAKRFEQSYVTGQAVRMSLAFYPGAAPVRALPLTTPVPVASFSPPAISLPDALDAMTNILATHPWQWPMLLRVNGVSLTQTDRSWQCQTAEGHILPTLLSAQARWELLAVSGGAAVTVVGEWDGQWLQPVSAWDAGEVIWQAGDAL